MGIKISITHSTSGIGNSEYFAERNLDISSMVMVCEEQMNLPFASGYSKRNMCALATSSVCTIDTLSKAAYCSLSPKRC